MKKLKQIDFIVIATGIVVFVGNTILGYLYATGMVGHNPFSPVELFEFLQYAWSVAGAIALVLYFVKLRHAIGPFTIAVFVLLLLLTTSMSRYFMMAASAAV